MLYISYVTQGNLESPWALCIMDYLLRITQTVDLIKPLAISQLTT